MTEPTASRRQVGRHFLRWGIVSTASSLPVAMAPLLFVFAAQHVSGSFAVGSLVVGMFVCGELIGASTIGVFGIKERLRPRLAPGFLVSGLAFGAVAVTPSPSVIVLLVLAFLAGFSPSAAPGALQSVLIRDVPEEGLPRLLVAARIQGTVVFMAGPALVGVFNLGSQPRLAPLTCAVLMLIAMVALPLLPDYRLTNNATFGFKRTLHLVWGVWPVYALGFAATFTVGLVDLVVPPLLVQRGESAGLAGPIAAAFFLVALLGSLAYGIRQRWPGSYASQSFSVTMMMVVGLCLSVALPTAAGLVAGLMLAGFGIAILLTIRTLALRQRLPEETHAAAFSVNYSISCASYMLCALVGGTALASASPAFALLSGAAAILAIGVASFALERRHSLVEREQQTPVVST